MELLGKQSAINTEWEKIIKKEREFIKKRQEKKSSIINKKLEEKVPEKLGETLDKAFEKAFGLVFQKGTSIIEKTYKREEIEKTYQVQQFEADLRKNKKSLNAMKKQATQAGLGNLMLSGISGVGLGALGIGLPDIPILIGLILKNIYEIALHYGFSYESEEEQYFILLIIQGANSYGEELKQINKSLNRYCALGEFSTTDSKQDQICKTSKILSEELLYMKFLQGIPIVGVVGGAYDVVYMQRINEYAKIKYRYRYLLNQRSRL